MNHVKRLIYKTIIILIIGLYSTFVSAKEITHLKIALLDNFTLEKYAALYKDSYYAGIETAILAAKKNHISIQFKNFTYDNDPLGVLNAIPSVKSWHPDAIIGPHYSNQFLLLRNHFKNVLVLSPYATDEALSSMPSNFYSLALPDKYMAKINYLFIKKYFPNRNVYNISQLDCKDCIDTTKNLDAIYADKHEINLVKDSVYLGNHINAIDIKKILRGYQKNNVIVLQPLNDLAANTLIVRITQFLKDNNLVFIYNVDNWGNSKNLQSIVDNAHIKPRIFRIVPWIINPKSCSYQTFVKYYLERFHKNPSDAVSYMTYRCVMSIIVALEKFPTDTQSNTQKSVLDSYSNALKKDRNWYRITQYAIFRHKNKRDVLIGVMRSHDHS